MEIIESHNICTKISQAGNVWKNKSGYRANIAKVMRAKRSRNNRSSVMPISHSYDSEYSTQFKYNAIHRVSKREKQLDDIRSTCQHEVQIWESTLLMQRVLCGHSWDVRRGNKRAYSESVGKIS